MTNPNIDIYGLLKNGKKEEIREKIISEIYKIATYCSKTIGEGYFGRVTVPAVGPLFTVRIDNEYVVISVVVKEAKNPGNIYIDDVDDTLVISSDTSLTCEAIMLYMLSKFWYKGANLHMPYMVGIGNCSTENPLIVTNIISERHGLHNSIELNYEDRIKNPMHLNMQDKDKRFSVLATIGDFFEYALLNYNDKLICKLENNLTVYFPDLIDYYCIFYLHTLEFLWRNLGMTLSDQHSGNIFVHWLNTNSRCGKKKLDQLKYIFYEVGKNKYMKVPVNGIVFKIGDVGTCLMNPQKNIMIVGDLTTSKNISFVAMYKNRYNLYLESLKWLLGIFPLEILIQTKIYKILLNDKYLAKYSYVGFTTNDDKNAPSELDILNNDIYKDFFVNEYNDGNENFVIHLDAKL